MAIETSGGIPATMLVGPTGYGMGYGGYGMGYGNGMWGGFGGDWGAWIILFLIFGIFGGNGFGGGFGGNGFQGALTRADLCQDMNFQQVENGVRGIQQGLCDGFYAVNTSMLNGFHGVDNAICSLGYQFQAGLNGVQTTVADCCCKTQTGLLQLGNQVERGFCDTNYAAQTNATAIMQNAHNDTDRILARLDAIESARKDETIADLRSKLAACGDQSTAQYIINQLTALINPQPVPAYPAASPCGLGNWSPNVLANYGRNGNCGCNGYNGWNG